MSFYMGDIYDPDRSNTWGWWLRFIQMFTEHALHRIKLTQQCLILKYLNYIPSSSIPLGSRLGVWPLPSGRRTTVGKKTQRFIYSFNYLQSVVTKLYKRHILYNLLLFRETDVLLSVYLLESILPQRWFNSKLQPRVNSYKKTETSRQTHL